MEPRKKLGQAGENLAKKYLQKKGLKVLASNLRFPFGEIDILAQDGDYLVVVEVKTKSNLDFGAPYEMVNFKKRRKLFNLARALSARFPGQDIRVDVVSIETNNTPAKIEHFQNILEA
ncbi:MAG: YraN family protein [Candidatus Nealsonbacteria bacterium CG23_combo_of_CG06-09_8_20_14_all_40_13]|uniref:UPF0102 protein COX39_00900 n=1 Tax=Candidatus Nealsonbacteria bacterium CG23_combo_of_CG06-09_8_20_14_all_40_13 TaxID=1974724 RepID=A0A2G9YRF0_9BACT|nr:MAG: YraN family protein [Candidatus Nealsonbacteria bacterium CG23_combo_of_CG06-09_8_20_14_all_40_13]PIR70820.1 MAG: YraN family protein [Candidatus Nealsonbacteria bacterium CG10_big_fil_rev_8_21_14_0_10_40_24]PIU43372.1 MAG: YraN family protein [Candidatus Nealsonbacteria bacterium CG07_land_8_20_14_0_80_40_10]